MRLGWRLKVLLYQLRYYVSVLPRLPLTFFNWHLFLTGRRGTALQVLHLRNGLKIGIRPQETDRATVSEIFLMNPYINKALGYEIRESDVVLDVGANIGAFTLYASRAAPKGKVFAIEPAKSNYDLLCENISRNNSANATAHHLGFSDADGELDLNVAGSGSSFHFPNGNPSGQTERVSVRTLKSFLDQHGLRRVDFLKMDCEGAEFDILMSADAATLGRIRRLAMEFHNVSETRHIEVLRPFLERAGFRVDRCAGEWNGILLAVANGGQQEVAVQAAEK